MTSHVVATAGHVDHGKSTLVRALTGIEPDRWAEERARGLTIDLGFAWTTLPSGRELAFVDVPGHERFIANMLAGLGPVPAVCFVIAADDGWQAQSSEHRDAIAALGIEHGIIVITRADRAPEAVPEVEARVRAEFRGTGLAQAPIISCSAATGEGLDAVRSGLDAMLAELPTGGPPARLRLWLDRAFTIAGAGTVVTGTLTAGRLHTGQRLELAAGDRLREVSVRGLQAHGSAVETIDPTERAALNLRGASAAEIHRGDVLISPGWWLTDTVDVRWTYGPALDDSAEQAIVHIGTAAVPARLRPFDADHARVHLDRALPLQIGDRLVLREPGTHTVTGVRVLDVDAPALRRRGAGRRRAAALAELPVTGSIAAELDRRQAVRAETLARFGLEVGCDAGGAGGGARAGGALPAGIVRVGGWLLTTQVLQHWARRLREAVEHQLQADALSAGMSRTAAVNAIGLPDAALLDAVAAAAQLRQHAGLLTTAQPRADLGAAEAGIAALEDRLRGQPFLAPEADELTRLRLGARELAAAERVGRLTRIADGIVLLPSAPAQAMRILTGLDQPFTASQARQALGTTRRVAIPLLEHLDSRGWTRRVDGNLRAVVR